ncbi:MAG: Chromate transporter [Thermotoga sp. 50_1627]|uniref:chromate transporter n=1 Tax=Pseudothermotoga sp. TaxID=2033661 RepID=UPI00076CA468|nr:MAG: Chromate transporter [Thermotoga sp. 50_64]KUK25584.1 MAG: Chromate transporter [Thermotoga sp. 50_1627]MDK2922620.1 chromate transporter [Pseudothermotoga sp.]
MNKSVWKRAWKVFGVFLKVSSLTLGGGYAMVPIMQWEAERLGWMKKEEFLSLLSVAQSIPGPIAFNTAIIVGKRVAGVPGAVLSGVAITLPPFVAIVAVASLLKPFLNNVYVRAFLLGVYAAVVALVFNVLLGLIKKQRWTMLRLMVIGVGVVLLLINRNTLYAVFAASIWLLYAWGE